MRLFFVAAMLVLSLAAATVAAAEPLRLEILSVSEEQGRITASIAVSAGSTGSVANLPEKNVIATLDGQSLPVTAVQAGSGPRPPISLVLMVDVSGSMYGDPIKQAQNALTDFIGTLDPADQVAVYSFSTSVRSLQDFTDDKAMAARAVGRLTPLGDTALYDAVIEASHKAGEATTERRLIVLLTDGVANINTTKRGDSLQIAQDSGANVVAIGLGSALDRDYLNELARVTGGRFLEAPTPSALSQAYRTLAESIRSQYNVSMSVPEGIDRTVPGVLKLTVTINGASATAERQLAALPGAIPPPLTLNVTGIASGMKLNSPVTLDTVVTGAVGEASVTYSLDDNEVQKSTATSAGYQLDPKDLSTGNHLLSVKVTDEKGRTGEKQIAFEVVPVASSGGGSSSWFLYPLALIPALVGGWYVFSRKRRPESLGYSNRIKPWRGKIPDVSGPMERPPGEWTPSVPTVAPDARERPLGRVVVMDEEAIRTGGLEAVREWEIGAGPLTLGTDSGCDIVVSDPEGRVGGEEARLWVQRGRLVYHKLTTLSAMATEGVTSGWQFLDSGEEIRVGNYRLVFQLEVPAEPAGQEPELPVQLPEIWPMRRPDEGGPLGASSD